MVHAKFSNQNVFGHFGKTKSISRASVIGHGLQRTNKIFKSALIYLRLCDYAIVEAEARAIYHFIILRQWAFAQDGIE